MGDLIQCSNCGKKLKLKSPQGGKKLRCPSCKEPLSVPSSRGPGKKKRSAAAVDVFDDDFSSEDYADEPAMPRSPRSKRGGKRSAKKQKSGGGSRVALIVGVCGVVAALVGGIIFMVSSSGDGSSDSETVVDSAEPAGTGSDSNSEHGVADEHSSTDEHGTSAAAAVANTVGGSQNSALRTPVRMPWLPANCEIIARVDVKRLLAGPLGSLLQNPMLAEPLQQFRDQAGFGIEAIDTITFGMAGWSDMVLAGKPPSPEKLQVVATLATNSAVELNLASLRSKLPQASENQSQDKSYLTVQARPGMPSIGLFVPDSHTLVATPEGMVPQIMSGTVAASAVDQALLSGDAAIQFALMPTNPDHVFRSETLPESADKPAQQMLLNFLKVVQPAIAGLSLNIDITNDFAIGGRMLTVSSQGATDSAGALKKHIAATKDLAQSPSGGDVPVPMQMALSQGSAVLDAVSVSAIDNRVEFGFSQPGGGQQLAAMAPMLPTMIGPAIAQARKAAQRTRDRNSLAQISLAMHNFASVYQRFPNALGRGSNGEEWLSWRVHLLPFLGYQELYEKFALEEPWDSPTNRPLVNEMPDIYRLADGGIEPGKTVYVVPIGPGMAFENGEGRAIRDFTDGTSNTILIVEVAPDRAVYWTQPADLTVDGSNFSAALGSDTGNSFQAAFVDGAVRRLSTSAPADTIRALMTRNGGESVDLSSVLAVP